ncbi:double zinc ribbon domain-containing protein [Halosolutus gelatinilyticus]|uniref:double zinc ribbon domain-containing protein n=1 Tax=Halosolutus gelatinilyticus TaxID=2931975 RepID=UPI001FF65D55|nr:zinc ribbon domain-containing protein [Halosolutus gelatinilyticus]
MSKVTFRADDELVEQLEALDASKSEVMRQALRSHLADSGSQSGSADQRAERTSPGDGTEPIDGLIRERVDTLLADRLRESSVGEPQDVNVNISLEGERTSRNTTVTQPPTDVRHDAIGSDHQCGQCGETIDADHVYCPNCGEKASHRTFCECGDELRSDWAFCPGCGRRTPAADVLDSP